MDVRKLPALLLATLALGCGAMPAAALVRSPVDSRCRSYGLKGCPELVDGALAFAQGDKALGTQKLEAARALNSPAKLKQFADALRIIGKTGPEAAAPLIAVADVLAPPTGGATTPAAVGDATATTAAAVVPPSSVSASAPGEVSQGRASNADYNIQITLLALAASGDPLRLFTHTVTLSMGEANCDVAGTAATCSRRQAGPLIVTDVVASSACADRAFLLSAFSDATGFGHAWVVPASMPGIHGARLVVRGGEWLHVGARTGDMPNAAKGECFVTWSGFRPRLAPSPTRE